MSASEKIKISGEGEFLKIGNFFWLILEESFDFAYFIFVYLFISKIPILLPYPTVPSSFQPM